MIRNGIYRHYKGQKYQVVGVARHSETEEQLVVYKMLYGDFSLWVRPLSMFTGTVDVEGVKCPRFEYLSESPDHQPGLADPS